MAYKIKGRKVKIIYKDISKTKLKNREAFALIKKLDKAGYKNAMVTDYKMIGKGRKLKGIGTKVLAFKGNKKVPQGFKSKMERMSMTRY